MIPTSLLSGGAGGLSVSAAADSGRGTYSNANYFSPMTMTGSGITNTQLGAAVVLVLIGLVIVKKGKK